MQPITAVAALLAATLSVAQAAPVRLSTGTAAKAVASAGAGAAQERICMHLRCPGFN